MNVTTGRFVSQFVERSLFIHYRIIMELENALKITKATYHKQTTFKVLPTMLSTHLVPIKLN